MTAGLKWGLIGGTLLLIIGFAVWYHHIVYASGVAAGEATIQTLWNKDKADIAHLAEFARDQALLQEAQAQATNQGIIHDLQAKLDASNLAGGDLARRLRNALSRPAASGSGMSQAAGGSAAVATSGVPNSTDTIVIRLASYDAACQRDAARLNALIEEVSNQLPKETMK